jgi:hypothetical protein
MKTVKKKILTIEPNVRKVLENHLFFTADGVVIGQDLERGLYVRVNEVLEALGGKWNRKVKAHVFEEDAAVRIAEALVAGSVVRLKESYDFFPTPLEVATRLIIQAAIPESCDILEPSAGRGAIADLLRERYPASVVDVVELMPENRRELERKGHRVVGADFLEFRPTSGYDRIVMNPPFSRQEDVRHVLHAYEGCLKPGGRLVSVVSGGVDFRSSRLTKDFWALVDARRGRVEDLLPGSFRESGTNVNTKVVILDKASA